MSLRPSSRRRRASAGKPIIISVTLFLLLLALAPPLQRYFSQRAQISAASAKVNALQSSVDQVQQELEKWRDPNYVKSQARARLHFVMPGERQYLIDTGNGFTASAEKSIASDIPTSLPWYTKLISSITQVSNAKVAP
jgi:hypothetical protein